MLYFSNKARGGVVYMDNIPQTPEVHYYYYKLVTNVIRAVKIHVLSYPWYTI
jgi:hypothetical protein